MDIVKGSYKTVDEYIKLFPQQMSEKLQAIRAVIQEEAPSAVETTSYQMPTFKFRGKNMVHFAAWKSHIGFYPTPSGTEKFKNELSRYESAKGSVQFPLDEPIPLSLIRRIVKFRVKEMEINKE